MKKKLVLVVIILFICFSYGKVEFLSLKYSDLFKNNHNNMIQNVDYCKVLKYGNDKAEVLFISDNHGNKDIVFYEKIDDIWTETCWKTVWSSSGTADGFIWPFYF